MSENRPQKSRGNPSMGDIVRSVAVLSLLVFALWAVGLIQTDTPDDPVREIDYAGTADSARQAATYPLLAPGELPAKWRVNGVRFEPGTLQAWHLGVLTADDRYIGLEQVTGPADDLLEQWADGFESAGTVDLAGRTWQRYNGSDDSEVTLVHEAPEGTTLVTTTTAPFNDVETFVESLTDH